jgi:hypothetical protein
MSKKNKKWRPDMRINSATFWAVVIAVLFIVGWLWLIWWALEKQ